MLKGIKVLIVEDDPDLLDTGYGLEMFGATVFRAPNGLAAIDWLKDPAHDVDVIVSDVRMPAGDGVQFLDAVRVRDRSRPPFFFITGYADLTLEEALAKGAQGMLAKPVGPAMLAQTVAQAVRK
jgi:CheY-like chemotaxis protein